MGEASEAVTTLRGLESAARRIQAVVASALAIQQAPTLRFHMSNSIKRDDETLRPIEMPTAETRHREVRHAAQAAIPKPLPANIIGRGDEETAGHSE